jgi:hypothetical protein
VGSWALAVSIEGSTRMDTRRIRTRGVIHTAGTSRHHPLLHLSTTLVVEGKAGTC